MASQESALRAIADHLHVSRNKSQIEKAAMHIFNTSSWTFQSGQIEGWKKHFTPLHIDEFKSLAGSLFIELGYEKDLNW